MSFRGIDVVISIITRSRTKPVGVWLVADSRKGRARGHAVNTKERVHERVLLIHFFWRFDYVSHYRCDCYSYYSENIHLVSIIFRTIDVIVISITHKTYTWCRVRRR